ncbi:MAG: TonB-dependent receptor [Bacteroidales bacterium]|nr:TonB-dependent receptor [Bacteroidales bacterium]
MYSFLAVISFFLGLSAVHPDTGATIRGKVFDKNTGESLPGVYVLYGKSLGTTTDENGYYTIETEPGKLNLTFQFVGYETASRDITLTEGQVVELDIGLATKIKEIDQIVISANKTEQRIAELTVSMDIITTSFLSENHITDAQELVNKTTGIEVLDGQASIRGGSGFSYGAGSRVLALIDGLPMVSADAGNIKWQYLPLENLSQIEIIKGASSVLYGSSALNGVINFRTSDASNIPVTQFFAETGVFDKPRNKNWVWWNTPRLFSNMSFSHLRKIGKTDLGVSGNLLTDDGYRRLNGEKLARLSLKIKHFNNKVEGLNYGFNLNTGYNVKKDFVLWEDAEYGALKQSEATAKEYHGTFLALDPYISYKKSNRLRHDIRIRLQSTTSRLPDSEENNSDALSLYSEYQLWYKLFDFLDLTAGLSENYSLVNSQFFDDHTAFNIAGFTQFEITPLPRLKAVAGLRIESNTMDKIHDRIVPIFRAGLNWQMADYTFLRASFGQGYRFPSMAEKHAATTIGSIIIVANPDLLPESGWNTEIGIKQGLSLGRLTGQADLSIFYMRNSNLIEYQFVNFMFMAINHEESRVYGAEAEAAMTASFGKINTTFTGGYSFIYPVEVNPVTLENTSTFLKYRRKHSLNLSVGTEWKRLEAGLNFYAKSKILNIDQVFLDTPILEGFDEYWAEHNTGYCLLDGTIGYKLTEKLTLSLAVKNLTNTEYMGRPGDIQPQRNYSLRFSGSF